MPNLEVVTALTPAPTATIAPAPFDAAQVLRVLGLNPQDPKSQALVLICQRYAFDPLLKHVVIIGPSMYVTRDGLMHVAHRSGVFDGMDVSGSEETKTHHIAVAQVWRKDMARAFVFRGRYPKSGRMAENYGPEMAEKVAVCRALRHAFDVSLCSREELWEQGEQENTATAQSAAAPVQAPAPTNQSRPSAAPSSVAPSSSLPPAMHGRSHYNARLLNTEKERFAEGATTLGFDVVSDTDPSKPSRSKIATLFLKIQAFVGFPLDPSQPADWKTAHDALPNYREHFYDERHSTESTSPPAEPAEPAAPVSERDDEDLTDPFAEDAMHEGGSSDV